MTTRLEGQGLTYATSAAVEQESTGVGPECLAEFRLKPAEMADPRGADVAWVDDDHVAHARRVEADELAHGALRRIVVVGDRDGAEPARPRGVTRARDAGRCKVSAPGAAPGAAFAAALKEQP